MVADMWGGVWIVLFRMSYSHWVFVVMHVPYCQKFTECDELVAALGRKLHAMYRTTADDEGPPAQPPTGGVAHTLCAAVTAPLQQSLTPTSGGAGVTPVAGTTAAPLTPASMKHGATDGAAATAATPTQAALASGGAIVGAVLESSSALLAAGWSSAVSAVTMVGASVAGAPTATPTAGAASDGVVVAAADSSGPVRSDAGGQDATVADAQAEASCNPEAESNDHSGVGARASADAGAGAGAGAGDGTDAGVAADSDGADGAADAADAADGTAATPAPHIGAQVGAAIWAAADVGSAALGGVMGAAAAALANTVGRASVTAAPGAVSAEHQHAAWLLLSVVDAPTAGRTSAGTAGDGSASTSTDDTPAAVGSAPSPPAFVKFSSLACAMTVLAQGMHEVAMTRME